MMWSSFLSETLSEWPSLSAFLPKFSSWPLVFSKKVGLVYSSSHSSELSLPLLFLSWWWRLFPACTSNTPTLSLYLRAWMLLPHSWVLFYFILLKGLPSLLKPNFFLSLFRPWKQTTVNWVVSKQQKCVHSDSLMGAHFLVHRQPLGCECKWWKRQRSSSGTLS